MKRYGPMSGLLVVAACWSRPVPPAPDRSVTVGVEATTLRLDNGLRVVLVPDPRATQISVTMQYAVGSSDDPLDSEGMAHVVEHVLFEPIRDGSSLMTRLQASALDFNGSTGDDATTYTERAWPAKLDELLAIEAARLDQRCASVTDEAFTRAREIVRNELRERDASWQIHAALEEALFPDKHPYHRDAPTLDSIASITKDDACAFADAHYGTNNAVLIVSGPIQRQQLVAALQPTLGRIHRDVAPRESGAPAVSRHRDRIEVPLKSPAVVIAWPIAADPVDSARQAAVIELRARLISTQVNASTSVLQLGGTRGRWLAIALIPSPDTTVEQALAGAERAGRMTWYGSALFEASRERAVYGLLDAFENPADRDPWIGEQVLAGRDPQQTLEARLSAVHAMSVSQGGSVAARLTLDKASIITLDPDPRAHVEAASVAPPIHEMPHTGIADPAAAAIPMPRDSHHSLDGLRVRTLPNGLRVVLAPTTSVRTYEARLVFPVGTAEEPAGERGVAMLAARGLEMNPGDGPLMIRFAVGGGALDVGVDTDDTVMAVRGVAGQLDQGLSALAQFVGDGVYRDLTDTRDELAREALRDPEDLIATRLWRKTLYGDNHPYVDAGLWQRANALNLDQVAAFRATYLVPSGATLIISGGFDADLADRWVDYAFADWRGEAPPVHAAPSHLSALAFAQPRVSSQVTFRMAFPAGALDRARGLVIAEMLSQAAGDVRESLAASYGVSAVLDETRGGNTLVIGGRVDAARAADAFTLLRQRIEGLRDPAGDTAVRFVEARARVADRLQAVPTSASRLAARITDAVVLGRPLDDDLRTAVAVRALTLSQVQPALARLDVASAGLLMEGPGAATTAAYGALGRHPTPVQ